MRRHAKVLLSYQNHDMQLALRVEAEFEKVGISTWDINQETIRGSIRDAIVRQARGAAALVLIVRSIDNPISAWGQFEVGVFWGLSKPVIILAADTVPASSLPVELASAPRHSFDPANPRDAVRRIADDLLAAA